jgi:hypothetical protein
MNDPGRQNQNLRGDVLPSGRVLLPADPPSFF